jgi:hypothetical protein
MVIPPWWLVWRLPIGRTCSAQHPEDETSRICNPPDRSDTDQSGSEFSARREEVVVDYRGTAEYLLPLAEASVVQLRPGPAPTNLEIFS